MKERKKNLLGCFSQISTEIMDCVFSRERAQPSCCQMNERRGGGAHVVSLLCLSTSFIK